jgi:hypothetical protein
MGRRDYRPGGSGILGQRAVGHVMTGSVSRLETQTRRRLRSPLALTAGASRRTLSPPGVIGGAVICCARRSVRIARHQFARAIGMDHATIRDVELGEIPLFCVPYDLLRQIAGALAMPGSALSGGVGELVTAADCDLLVTAMLCEFEDYAEVPCCRATVLPGGGQMSTSSTVH